MFADVVEELNGLGDAGLAARLQQLESQRRALEAELAATINTAARHGSFRADGHRSVAGWVKSLINCSGAEAIGFVRLGALLHDIAECGERLHDGEVGVAAMGELARARRNPRCGDQLAEAAEVLLGHAETRPFSEFQRIVRRWELVTDPDGAFKDVETNNKTRTASVSESDGSVFVRASGGTAGVAAEMRQIFDRFCHAEFLTDWDHVVAAHGDGVSQSMMERSDAQRRFDALAAIFRAAACSPLDARVPEPTVNIVVDLRTFEEHLARTFAAEQAAARAATVSSARFSSGPFRSTSNRRPGRGAADDDDDGFRFESGLGDIRRYASTFHGGIDSLGEDESFDDERVDEERHDGEERCGDHRFGDGSDPWLRRSETAGGTLIHPAEILSASLIGHVRRVVLDSAGTVIDLGRRRRLFTGAAKEAVRLHAASCVWPGCDISVGRCEVDHLDPWNNAGPTAAANGAPLCRHHNQTKNRGFTTRRDASGHWHVCRPDGTELDQPPLDQPPLDQPTIEHLAA